LREMIKLNPLGGKNPFSGKGGGVGVFGKTGGREKSKNSWAIGRSHDAADRGEAKIEKKPTEEEKRIA